MDRCEARDNSIFSAYSQIQCTQCTSDPNQFYYPKILTEDKFINSCIVMPLKENCLVYRFENISL